MSSSVSLHFIPWNHNDDDTYVITWDWYDFKYIPPPVSHIKLQTITEQIPLSRSCHTFSYKSCSRIFKSYKRDPNLPFSQTYLFNITIILFILLPNRYEKVWTALNSSKHLASKVRDKRWEILQMSKEAVISQRAASRILEAVQKWAAVAEAALFACHLQWAHGASTTWPRIWRDGKPGLASLIVLFSSSSTEPFLFSSSSNLLHKLPWKVI